MFKTFIRSIFRVGLPNTDRKRAEAMTSSFFLHIQPATVHNNTLRFSATFGLGLISFYLFIILIITGVLIMFYYIPSVNEAYDSMKDIQFVVSFGRLFRNMHRWAAHLMVASVFLHMCRVFYTGSYKPPREFNWVVGVMLLLLTLFLSFTGYLLPWDQLAYWAITVGTSIAGYIPFVGEKIRFILLGGSSVGQSALLRFYVLHIIVLPGLALFLIAVHFWRIRKDGGLARPDEESSLEEPSKILPSKTYGLMALIKGDSTQVGINPDDEVFAFPHLIFREVLLFLAVVVVLLGLSLLFDAPLEELANPIHPPNPAKAPWYFLGLQEMVSYSAFVGGVLIPGTLVLLLFLLPYIDRRKKGAGIWFSPERKFLTTIFTVCIITAIVFILIGSFFRGPNWAFILPWKKL